MPPKKKTKVSAAPVDIGPAPPLSTREGTNGNLAKGMLRCPVELQHEILDYFLSIGPTSHQRADRYNPILNPMYLEQTDVLRSLSQVCLDYRRAFLPMLYETVNVCCAERKARSGQTGFYRHAGETLRRKFQGLKENPELGKYVRKVNLVITRFKGLEIMPLFASSLATLPNLHTIHILHAHSQMSTKFLKPAFENITLPSVRLLIISGHCHEILRACPNAKNVWNCMWGGQGDDLYRDGSKIVSVVGKSCKDVEELRGFTYEEKTLKTLAKAAPNLKTFGHVVTKQKGIDDPETLFKYLSALPKLSEVVLQVDREPCDAFPEWLEKNIEVVKAFLKTLPPRPEPPSLRLWNVRDKVHKLSYTNISLSDN